LFHAAAYARDNAVRTIAVVNRKGGSGKTTTAVSLAAALAERGLPTLLVDLDPQGSSSAWLTDGADDRGSFDAFTSSRDLGASAVKTQIPGLDLVRSSAWLLTAEQTLKGDMSVGVMRAIERLRPDWAFLVIDCPPSLSYLSVGALMGVREVVIPVEAHAIALSGVAAVVREIHRLQSTLNPVLWDPMIVACRVNRTRHAQQVIAELEERYGWLVARARIRESIRFAEAEASRLAITQYAPESGACLDYRQLAEELIGRQQLSEPTPRRASRWRRLFTRSPRVAASTHRAL
jgi:chromosome partitioning protein